MAEFKMVGVEALMRDLNKFPDNVSRNVQKKGLRKAAARMRTYLRRAAPRVSGELRNSIAIGKPSRSNPGRLRVGLMRNFYYKTLEFGREGGAPMHPFFESAAERHAGDVSNVLVEETQKALAYEAGKIYARSQQRKR